MKKILSVYLMLITILLTSLDISDARGGRGGGRSSSSKSSKSYSIKKDSDGFNIFRFYFFRGRGNNDDECYISDKAGNRTIRTDKHECRRLLRK